MSTGPTNPGADRHDTAPWTVLVGSRVVGYRRFGAGPAVALLHSSPRSAAALLPLGLRLAERFTVFAFDTPGFGWSDPLRLDRPDAQDFAAALIETFDALGLGRVPLYGSHTGAAIAVAAAVAYPDRIACLVLDGYAAFDGVTQSEMLASYLAPIAPQWDGTHLAWLWSRVKDQFTVFPWNRRGQASRLSRPLVSDAVLQAVVCDFLAAGDDYRAAYAAAFRYDHLAGLRAVTVPTAATVRSDDLLSDHLDQLTDMPACVTVRRLGTDDTEWAASMSAALAVGASSQAPPPLAPITAPGAPAIHRIAGGTIGLIRSGPVTGPAIVLLPPIPGSARGLAGLAGALAAERPVIAVDLPGFGGSALPGAPDAAAIADALLAALRAGGVERFDLVAMAEAGSIGVALAAAAGQTKLILVDPVPDEDRSVMLAHLTDISPRPEGGHLLAAWHQLRDRTLWRPWFKRDPAHAIDAGPDPDVPMLQAILTDWMRGGEAGRDTLAAAMHAGLTGTLPPGTTILDTNGPGGTDLRRRAAAIIQALAQH